MDLVKKTELLFIDHIKYDFLLEKNDNKGRKSYFNVILNDKDKITFLEKRHLKIFNYIKNLDDNQKQKLRNKNINIKVFRQCLTKINYKDFEYYLEDINLLYLSSLNIEENMLNHFKDLNKNYCNEEFLKYTNNSSDEYSYLLDYFFTKEYIPNIKKSILEYKEEKLKYYILTFLIPFILMPLIILPLYISINNTIQKFLAFISAGVIFYYVWSIAMIFILSNNTNLEFEIKTLSSLFTFLIGFLSYLIKDMVLHLYRFRINKKFRINKEEFNILNCNISFIEFIESSSEEKSNRYCLALSEFNKLKISIIKDHIKNKGN